MHRSERQLKNNFWIAWLSGQCDTFALLPREIALAAPAKHYSVVNGQENNLSILTHDDKTGKEISLCIPLLESRDLLAIVGNIDEHAANTCFSSFRGAYLQATSCATRIFAHPPHRSRVARRGVASAAFRTGRYAAPSSHC